jgi:hypothetical protein
MKVKHGEGRQHGPQLAEELPEGMRLGRGGEAVRRATHRLPQRPHEEREQEPGQAHHEVRDLPALEAEGCAPGRVGGVPALDHLPADHEREPGAEVDPARVDREHRRAPRGGEVVREHRVGGGARAGLAHTHPHARGGQLREAAREPRKRGHQAPHAEPQRDQRASVPHVRETAERDAEQRVEDREGGAVQEADLRVAEAEIRLDLVRQDRDDLAIEEVEHVDGDQDAEDVARVARADAFLGAHSTPASGGRLR